MPQMKKPELVSSQAQSLTRKYQETKELLKVQELKKRNMQAQLGLSLSHFPDKKPYFSEPQKPLVLEDPPPESEQKTISVLLQDRPDAIQELEGLITGEPVTLMELGKVLKSHSCNQETPEKYQLQKVLETWRYQQELENETIKKSLARAGESIREYEARLLTIEDLVGKVQRQMLRRPISPVSVENHPETTEKTVGMLSQRVEVLTNENGALKQRCQEIVNQLTEADREIDRLKAELINQQSSKQHHLIMEELKQLKAKLADNKANAIDRDYYERELNEKSLRLHEALVTLEELGSTLKETEKKLHLKEATLKGLGLQRDYEDVEIHPEKALVEALHANSEMEAKLQLTEQCCATLEASSSQLITLNQESEEVSREKLAEAENQIRWVQEKMGRSETDSKFMDVGEEQVDDKRHVKKVVEEIEKKTNAINQVLEMLAKVDFNIERMCSYLKSTLFGSLEEQPLCVSQSYMRWVVEGEFWSQLLGSLETNPVETRHNRGRYVVEQMVAQKRLMILIDSVCPESKVGSEVLIEPELASMYSWFNNETHGLILKELTETLEAKLNGLKKTASRLMLDEDKELLSLALASFDCGSEQKEALNHLVEALTEAYMLYMNIRLRVQHDKELKQKLREVEICYLDCPNCLKLREVVRDLQSKLSDTQTQLCEASMETGTAPQTLIQIEGETIHSLDKTTELHYMTARHRKELQEVKDHYEQEAEKMRQEVAKTSEMFHLHSEENAKEINSLTNCMEDLKKKHKTERTNLMERFEQEMDELRSMMSLINSERTFTDEQKPLDQPSDQTSALKERIQELVMQVSVMAEEMRRREEQGDVTTQRLKYEKDLENLKVEAFCDALCTLGHSQIHFPPPPNPNPTQISLFVL